MDLVMNKSQTASTHRDGITRQVVTALSATDEAKAIDTLTLAFASDPGVRWFFPDATRYLAHFPRFARAFGGQAFEQGSATSAAGALAVALWMAPGVGPRAIALDGHKG